MANDLLAAYEEDSAEENNPPKGYKPLTPEERYQWNNFVRFLNKDKKIGGDKSLDERDRSRGIEYMEEYRKLHPEFTITPSMIKNVQYEFQLLRDVNSLPDQTELNPHIKKLLGANYPAEREISDVDGWIGSLTSRQTYPELQAFSDDKSQTAWGTNYRGASDYADKFWTKKSK